MPRYVPAHSAVFIETEAQREMVEKFSEEFGKTWKNRVRSYDDMQFAFTYYYFLVHEKIVKNIAEIFDEFDVDKSG